MNNVLVDLCSYLGYVCPCAAGLLLHDNSGTAGEEEEDYSPQEVRPLLQKIHPTRRQHMRRGRQPQHASASASAATRRPTASSCTRDNRRLRSVSRPRLLPPPQPQLCSDRRRSASPRATPANALPRSRSEDAVDEVVVISVFSPPREETEHGSADESRPVRKSTVFTQHEDAEWNVIIAK